MKFVKNFLFSILRFLREVKIEMKRVNWLKKKQVINYTLAVVALSLIVGIYLGALDFVFSWILGKFVL